MAKTNTDIAFIKAEVKPGHCVTKKNQTIELRSVIGEGSGAPVYSAIGPTSISRDGPSKNTTPMCFAVKVFRRPSQIHKNDPNLTEYDHHLRASSYHTVYHSDQPTEAKDEERHPHILPLYDVFFDHANIFFVMEYCEAGDLYNLAVERELWGNDALIKSLFLHVVSGVEHCHRLMIYHRDIKPQNVVLKRVRDRETGEETLSAMLADFGLATKDKKTRGYCIGTAGYRSPEGMGLRYMVSGYYTHYADIWALGCLLAFMITGHTPWDDATTKDECFMHYLNGSGYEVKRGKRGYLIVEPQTSSAITSSFSFPSDVMSHIQAQKIQLEKKATLLRELIPLSTEAATILAGIFDVHHVAGRTSLEALTSRIKEVTSFSMLQEEVLDANYRLRWIVAEMSGTPGVYLDEEERKKEAQKDQWMLEKRKGCACRDCADVLRKGGVDMLSKSHRMREEKKREDQRDVARVLADMNRALPVEVFSSASGSYPIATDTFLSSPPPPGSDDIPTGKLTESESTTNSRGDFASNLTADNSSNTTSSVGVITPPDALAPLRPVDTVPDIEGLNAVDAGVEMKQDATSANLKTPKPRYAPRVVRWILGKRAEIGQSTDARLSLP